MGLRSSCIIVVGSALIASVLPSAQAATLGTVSTFPHDASFSTFSEAGTRGVGQTFTLSAPDTLASFTFAMNVTNPAADVEFKGYVYSWNRGNKRVVTSLFAETSARTLANPDDDDSFVKFTVNTGDLDLVAGDYVAFIFSNRPSGGGAGTMAMRSDNPYAGGELVSTAEQFSAIGTQSWAILSASRDLAFDLNFIPEPGTLLGGVMLGGLVLLRRRRA